MTSTPPSNPTIPVTPDVLSEAQSLSEDILKDIELSQMALSLVVLKALRLARILNEFDFQQIFQWESGGYPRIASGVSPEVWAAGMKVGRTFFGNDSTPAQPKTYMYTESIEHLEHTVAMGTAGIQAAQDPDISISSANQYQSVPVPSGNASVKNKYQEPDASG